jgi:hypothetical protein
MDIIWEPYLENVPDILASDIARVEQSIGSILPNDIQTLLQAHAGQVTQKETIALTDKGHKTVFGPILVAVQNSDFPSYTYTVSFAISALNDWDNAVSNKKLIPFASNTASGWFCVDISNPAATRIVFVDTSYDPDEAGAISYIAKDVPEMLSKLQ